MTVAMETLESLCLTRVVELIPVLRHELEVLPVALFKSLLPRCGEYQLAVIRDTASAKGICTQSIWQDLCRIKFTWFYHHCFQPNLHDPLWQCHECQAMTLSDLGSKVTDWYQTFMDKTCEGNLEKLRTKHAARVNRIQYGALNEEVRSSLTNPLMEGADGLIRYTPHQLFLNIKTIVALATSPWALARLAGHLRTLMCRVQVPTEYREPATSSLEQFLGALLAGGKLETVYLKEQQLMRGEAIDYSCLLRKLLIGGCRACQSSNACCKQDANGHRTHNKDAFQAESPTAEGDRQRTKDENEGDFADDLYDFCFKEPVKMDFSNLLEDDGSEGTDDGVVASRILTNGLDLFCEEGMPAENNMETCTSSDHVVTAHWKDSCCHYVGTDTAYFHHIPSCLDPRPAVSHCLSSLVLVYVRLSPETCTALSDCLAQSSSLKSLALIQCVMPECGWCEVLSGIALGSQRDLLLDELALTCISIHRTPPKSTFGQYCCHKLNKMMESYHRRGHVMTSLKLELLLSYKCQAAENSYLPTYLPHIRRLTLNCWGLPQSSGLSTLRPLHQLALPADLSAALACPGSVLTDLLLENSSLETQEVDRILAAAADAPLMKRVSVKNNRYAISRPNGLLTLLRHKALSSLNISRCKFSLKSCEEEYQVGIVNALINNCTLQHLNLSDGILDDFDLAILGKAFAETKRTPQQPGYCLNICLSPFSSVELMAFGKALSKTSPSTHSGRRTHSLEHLSIDWRCVRMVRQLRAIIPRVTCPHRLS